MTKNQIRWGLVSTANINRRLIPAIRKSKIGKLTAVASRSSENAQKYAKEWDIPLTFGSYQAMLDSEEVDAVYIGLPNHLHAEWSIKAMQTGVHVLCEKPFAITLEEVDQMMAVQKETGMVLAEAFMYRHHPQTKLIGEWVKNGKIGDVTLIRGTFDFAFKTRDNIRLKPEWGGGCLWDVGVYPLSFAQFIMGEPPEWVSGTQWVGDTGVDETFAGLLHYSGNRIAQISSAFRTPWHTFIEIIGTKGRIYIDRPFVSMNKNQKALFTNEKGKEKKIAMPKKDLYLGEVEDMHSAILEGSATYIHLEETRNHVRTVLALYEAARTHKIVYL